MARRPALQTSSPLKPKHQPRTHIGIGTAKGDLQLRLSRPREVGFVEGFLTFAKKALTSRSSMVI